MIDSFGRDVSDPGYTLKNHVIDPFAASVRRVMSDAELVRRYTP